MSCMAVLVARADSEVGEAGAGRARFIVMGIKNSGVKYGAKIRRNSSAWYF